jgi:D-alanine--poly(phosphoribitol) ligase subunit 2
MANFQAHYQQIFLFFYEKLNVNVPSKETDLLETGILDSLGLVELLVYLETTFGMKIILEKIEFDNFRSITKIAEFIEQLDPRTMSHY